MAYAPRKGSRVRYRDGAGKIKKARITAVGTGGALTLLRGSAGNGATVVNAPYQSAKGSTAGWVRGGR